MFRRLAVFSVACVALTVLCGSTRLRPIRNDERAKSMECPVPCVNFRMPGTPDGLVRIWFGPNPTYGDTLYHHYTVEVTGLEMSAPQSARLQRYLARDGFPTERDMPVVPYLEGERFRERRGAHKEYAVSRRNVRGIWYGYLAGRWVADSLIVP